MGAVMTVRNMLMGSGRQIDDLAVSHAAFGDDVVGELLHFSAGSLQTVTSMQLSWSR